MDLVIKSCKLSENIRVIPSKSQAHRLLICAAFADRETFISCPETGRDIEATAACLRALGSDVQRTADGYLVKPAISIPCHPVLPCRDSGSTLRFLLPVVGALGISAEFHLEGRLAQRPLSPLWEEMERMGCSLSFLTENVLECRGKLRPGTYEIAGNVSSQFISGLLFAAALIHGRTQIIVTDKLESKPYVEMTCQALEIFGCNTEDFTVCGGTPLSSPSQLCVEGDWSNGAFFLAANVLGSQIQVENLSDQSLQGDRCAAQILPSLRNHCVISVSDIPDLVPIMAVVAAANHGATFTDVQRLRLKESDRVSSVVRMIRSLGGRAEATETQMTVYGGGLTGGTVDCVNDHRIAMAAAIAATVCKDSVYVLGAECVEKSYPRFFEEFRQLGGIYEQYLR